MKERDGVMKEIWGIFGEMEIDNIEGISPAKAINKILSIPELAILSDDQSVPETKMDGIWVHWAEVQKDKMLKQNFKRVI